MRRRGPPHLKRDEPPAAAEGPALRLAWAASLGLVLGGVGAALWFRAEIAEAWPPFARVTALLGG